MLSSSRRKASSCHCSRKPASTSRSSWPIASAKSIAFPRRRAGPIRRSRVSFLAFSTEHLLLALAEEKGATARQLLSANGVTRKELLAALEGVRGAHRVTDQEPENQYQALQRFTRDLTEVARKGKLDPVIGRDEEIRRVMQVLSRRTKNNPVLI